VEYTIIGDKEAERRLKFVSMAFKHTKDNFMSLIHTDEAHKECLHPEPDVFIVDCFEKYKSIFDEYPEISAKSIFERYLNDEKNRKRRIEWDVIPAEQYHNLLKRYMEMGEGARIPMNTVLSWFNTIKRNTVILYYISYMHYRKKGFPFEIIPFETTNVQKSQMWLVTRTNFYEWAKFKNGAYGYIDRPFEALFNIMKEYNESMSPEQVLVLINRMLQVSHPASGYRDFTECFIEGGRKTCNKIANWR